MTMQRNQHNSIGRTMSLAWEVLGPLRETFAIIFRQLIPPRAWLRAFIVAYLGTRLLLFLTGDVSNLGQAVITSTANAPNVALAVQHEPSIPPEAGAKLPPFEQLQPTAEDDAQAASVVTAADSSPSVWRITIFGMLVLLAIEFAVNLTASLVAGCAHRIRCRWSDCAALPASLRDDRMR